MGNFEYTIEDLIPHREKMSLLDHIVAARDDWIEAQSVVRPTWPMSDGTRVDSLVLIEVLAQTSGLLTGWQRRKIEPQGGRGFFVGIRSAKLTVTELLVGTELRSRVSSLRQVVNYGVFEGSITLDGVEICRAEIQALRPDEKSGSWLSQRNM